MSYPEEVHQWTTTWFESLPQSYQYLDSLQKNPQRQLWDGLNSAPFDMAESGGWSADVIDEPRRAIFLGFTASPGEKVHYQIWARPGSVPGGTMLINVFDTLNSRPLSLQGPIQITGVVKPGVLEGYFYPPLHGQFTVHLSLIGVDSGAGPVDGSRPDIDAASISKRRVTYIELPRQTGADGHTYYPLLRFMDGIGQIGGRYRELSDSLWDGLYTNTDTCPEKDLPWLAQMLGIHRRIYRNLEMPALRTLIKNTATNGLAALGSRASIAEIVKPHLIGEQKVTAGPTPRSST